jgi:uncharacterized protein YjbI with pentapeptide repeats
MLNSKTIGNRITAARKKMNLSQAELAQKVSISAQAVGKWERGESLPDILTLNRLAEILAVDLNYFSELNLVQENDSHHSEDASIPGINEQQTSKGKLPSWDMSEGNWVDADFSNLKNLKEKFSSSNMKDCKFRNSELSGLLLKNNNVDGCDFSGSDIKNSQFKGSNLGKNAFVDCSLLETEFLDCNIDTCDFTNADLTGAVFKSSNYYKNTQIHTVWSCVSFVAMNIESVVFDGTVENCSFEGCSFSKVTFQNAKLLNTFFKCRNLKRIKFIDCTADRMTYEFLKNGKADLTGVKLIEEEAN